MQILGEVGKVLAPVIVRIADGAGITPTVLIAPVNVLLGVLFILPLKETLNQKVKE